MALNLSTLTSPATSGNVLEEITTTADFLEPVPVLRNLARGSNAGGDAKQDVALNQPKALPLIDGDGYLYLSGVSGNYAEVNGSVLPASGDFDLSIDFILSQTPTTVARELLSQYEASATNRFLFSVDTSLSLRVFWGGAGTYTGGTVVLGQRHTARLTRSGTTVNLYLDSVQVNSWQTSANIYQVNTLLGRADGITQRDFLGAIFSVTEGSNTDVDFTSTNVRHNDTKFQCATGQTVTINQSGNDPATIIKKSVLRFDGVNNGLNGLFNQTFTEGYMFAAFSVLGDGGESYGRLFSAADSAGFDISAGGFVLRSYGTSANLNLNIDSTVNKNATNGFTSDLGDYVLESRLKSGETTVRINGTVGESYTDTFNIDAEKFNIGEFTAGDYNASFDLEYLALFPATITDAQADDVRKYINNRNTVFYRWDTDGYYFYNPQDLSSGAVTTWNGRIVGSDNGDADKNATQSTSADQPTSDGYKVTFADNTDHFDIPQVTLAAGDSYAWMVCGTSLGTFAYKVTVSGETELNLLGHLGDAAYRKAGDLYGVILLPESATGRHINEAKKLLIDRGASESATADVTSAWQNRSDIVQFDGGDMSSVTNAYRAWRYSSSLTSFSTDLPAATNASAAWYGCSSLESFNTELPLATTVNSTWGACSSLESFNTELPLATSVYQAWYNCSSLSDFETTDIKNCSNFSNAWNGCSSLTSFPADAKLGTEASNVNFESAWRSSGLTSFSTPLPTATNVSSAWNGCTSLASFSTELPSVTVVNYAWYNCSSLTSFSSDLSSVVTAYAAWFKCSSLTSFGIELPLVTNVTQAWRGCTSLTSFSSDLPSVTTATQAFLGCTSLTSFSTELPSATNVSSAWQSCSSLTDFSADVFANWNPSSITSGIFNQTWLNCPLTAQSVENILTSIDASGKYATSTGLSGGTALADAGIDIDYNGDPLSAATTAAIDSLSGKGWQVYINGELVIPNILDLQPAAAYSLRSFDADADPNVVNVRRSSDGATSDFTASEVSDGTLTDWVNTEYETVTNGEFTTDSDWSEGSGWDIANGKASSDGTQTGLSYLFQSSNMGASQSQRVTLVVSDYVTGTVKVRLGNSAASSSITPAVSSNGTHVFTLPSHTDPSVLFIEADANFQGSIESISVVQLTADGHVTTWYDQSDNGNDSTQSTASNQPKIVDGGTLVTEGGLAALDFDGVDDYMETNGYIVELSQNPASVFAVATPDIASSSYLLTEGDDVSPYSSNFILNGAGGGNGAGVWVNATLFGSPIAANSQALAGFIYDGTNFQAYLDGATNGSSGTATVNTETSVNTYIASSADATTGFFDGGISEIVTFKNDQSSNRTGIENNINDYFDIYS